MPTRADLINEIHGLLPKHLWGAVESQIKYMKYYNLVAVLTIIKALQNKNGQNR